MKTNDIPARPNWFRRVLAPPKFDGVDKTQTAVYLNIFFIASIVLLGASIVISVVQLQNGLPLSQNDTLLTGLMLLVIIVLLVIMRRGHVLAASIILLAIVFVAMLYIASRATGIFDGAFMALVMLIIMAGLLLGEQAAVVMTVLSIAAAWWLANQSVSQPGTFLQDAPFTYAHDVTIILITLGFLIYMLIRSLRRALKRSRASEQSQREQNVELTEMHATLEQRVAERTAQLQISAEVGRVAASILDPDQMLREVVTLITERFGFYYAAAFLLDESGKSAVLCEATGQAGQTLKERGHALEIGGQSMVGYAIAQRKPRIASDVDAEAIRFANPLLPETRSEIALPLIIGDRVLGALDVQSTQPAAFDESYATMLQVLASQIAVALNNARQFMQTKQQVTVQANLNQLSRSLFSATGTEALYRILAEQIRNVVPYDYLSLTLAQSGSLLHEYELRADTSPVLVDGPTRAIDNSLSGRACNTHQIAFSTDTTRDAPSLEDMADLARSGLHSAVSLPLLLGDHVLGTLNLARRQPAAFLAGEMALFNQIAGPIGAAIENARLAEAQQRTLQELETLTQQLTKQAWSKQIQQMPGQVKYTQYARSGIKSISPEPLPELETAMQTAEPIAWTRSDDQPNPSPYQATLATPIMLRGEVLGGLQVSEANRPRAWSEEDITFIQAVADQVALALDNARLIDQTERRAQTERVISEIGNKLLSASDLPGVVRIASEELGRVLHIARVETTIGGDYLGTEAEGLAAAAGNGHQSEG